MRTILKTLLKALAIVILVVITVNLTESYNANVKAREVAVLVRAERIEALTEKLQEITIEETIIELENLPKEIGAWK